MASAPPVAFRQPKHVRTDDHDDEHRQHHARPRLPVIPDLRFEYSYLRSVQPFVEVEWVGSASTIQVEKQTLQTKVELVDTALSEQGYETLDVSLGIGEKERVGSRNVGSQVTAEGPREIIKVEWRKVLWATMRDQVISPLVQGALWALASHFLTPYSMSIGSRMGSFVHNHIPTKEGLGVAWLRNWVQSLRAGGNSIVQASRTSR